MKKFNLKNLDCANCAAKIEENVAKIDGVNSVSVNFFTTTMKIDFDENRSDEIIENIRKIIKKFEPDTVLEV
ncbi:heavy-metal-associated domain-containing protein [Campylobacter ureolyticus]|uniref:Heavy-metal-associated domain-containing protein n=1 Tax=Campylobacter ureolyticus TaxID=827 RepID=A0AAE7JP99_9BACT|nr:heavy metal-associated domain-containing protein [Campylobacter ureolyticus]MCR8683990.1 heavy-metal-associated domain-containing protein [Campylobacter ureolyticus]QKF83953.1 heavy-metal-associated domain-containing protein [Campylobacter ureolyticus]QQY35897.1 heavy-metal-associated domain-containing protein [Campylobacter ureolyticus]SUX24377.1 Cadmium, zinc and cobalt-transporting ATPase [Campylobacter ureolyticus]